MKFLCEVLCLGPTAHLGAIKDIKYIGIRLQPRDFRNVYALLLSRLLRKSRKELLPWQVGSLGQMREAADPLQDRVYEIQSFHSIVPTEFRKTDHDFQFIHHNFPR